MSRHAEPCVHCLWLVTDHKPGCPVATPESRSPSSTPRTDAVLSLMVPEAQNWALADVARELERERAELEAECFRYREEEADRDYQADQRAATPSETEKQIPGVAKITSVTRAFDYLGNNQNSPWVMVYFPHDDWDSRDAFAKAIGYKEEVSTESERPK